MRKAIVLIALIAGLLLGGICTKACAETCENPVILFPFTDAQNIVVTYDRLEACVDLLRTKDEIIAEQGKNEALLEIANKRLTEALNAAEQANTALKEVLEVHKEYEQIQAQKCAEDIEKAKPGPFRDLGIFGLGGITGAIAVIVGLLLL